jgi:hypothetical protein
LREIGSVDGKWAKEFADWMSTTILSIETWCTCSLAEPRRDFPLLNLAHSAHGLYIVVAEPR